MTSWGVKCVAIAAVAMAVPSAAKAPAFDVKALMAQASDNALTKLEAPGAFYADKAVRIMLPGPLKKLGGLTKLTDQAGLTRKLTKSMNDAAGIAAGAAKPVFRNAIQNMTLGDAAGIVLGGGNSVTDYLKSSSGQVLQGQLRPLVEQALRRTGSLSQFDKLAKAPGAALLGLDSAGFTASVTEQAANGIFKYMATEEARLRQNPLGIGKDILKGIAK